MGWFERLKSRIASDAKEGAPVIESPHERGFDREYRRPGDPPHVIRINQHPPKGLSRKLVEYVEVAGISQDDARLNAEEFTKGTNRRVELKREPTNKYDPNAIKVIGIWTNTSGVECKGRIGWVPSRIAKNIAQTHSDSPIGATLETIYRSHHDKGAGIRIDIWCPKAKTKKLDHNSQNLARRLLG